MANRFCRGLCHNIKGYDLRKKIDFAYEQGFRKCSICECHFKIVESYCGCCNNKLRTTHIRRRQETKEKVKMILATGIFPQ